MISVNEERYMEKEKFTDEEFEALFEVDPSTVYPEGLDTTGLNL